MTFSRPRPCCARPMRNPPMEGPATATILTRITSSRTSVPRLLPSSPVSVIPCAPEERTRTMEKHPRPSSSPWARRRATAEDLEHGLSMNHLSFNVTIEGFQYESDTSNLVVDTKMHGFPSSTSRPSARDPPLSATRRAPRSPGTARTRTSAARTRRLPLIS